MDDDDADSPCDWHFYCLPTAAAPAAPSSNLPDQELHDSEQKDKPNEDKNPCYFDSALGSESETENAPIIQAMTQMALMHMVKKMMHTILRIMTMTLTKNPIMSCGTEVFK
jgi:hypothetical protein